MGKIRVYELAKEFGMGNKELVQRLQDMGYPVKSHSSTIEDFLLKEIRDRLSGGKTPEAARMATRPTVIRRRKKTVLPDEEPAAATPEEIEETEPLEEITATARPPEPDVTTPEPTADEVQAEAEMPERADVGVGPEEIEDATETPTFEPIHQEKEEPELPDEPALVVQPDDVPVEAEGEEVPLIEPMGEPETMKKEMTTVETRIEPEVVVMKPETVEAEVAPAGRTDEVLPEKKTPVESVPPEEPEKTAQAEPEMRASKKTEPMPLSKEKSAVKHEGKPKGKTKPEPRIKKIEKTTSEPAKIISRPPVPEVVIPPPKPAPPKEPAPSSRPQPRSAPPGRTGGPPPSRTGGPPPSRTGGPPPQRQGPDPGFNKFPPDPASEAEARKSRKKKKSKEVVHVENDASRKKAGSRRREIIERTELYDKEGWDRPGRSRRSGGRSTKKVKKTEITVPKAIKRRIKVVDAITVADLAKKMGIKANDIIRKLISMGIMTGVNQPIDFETATLIASDFDYEVEKGSFDEEVVLHVETSAPSDLTFRPPVVTIMGHVDHGKTSLLDAIRKTNVIEGEAGGITQHIGAYHVEVEGGRITFLDTPGHAAFTAMRARGAKITDIVVLVVAADDGVMLQTREAADHARAAGVPVIVAVNKIDKPDADSVRIRRESADLGMVPEDWGGDTIFVDLSAKTGEGINDLLEMILLQAEVLELKADPTGRAQGRVVEARLDKGRGPVATILVQAGCLKQGDPFVCGVYHGKIRAMFDDKGQRVDEAGPAIPVEIQGLSGVPAAGDEFVVVEDEKRAKQVSQHRQLKQRESELIKTTKLTLENLFDSIKEGGAKELNIVLKADVQGSIEAIADALNKLEREDIKVGVIHSSTGAISETDIMLASASNALIIGFNVRANAKIQDMADQEKVQIRYYDVIYKLIDEIKEAMAGLLEPIQKEKLLGHAEVRSPFHVSKVGTIAGSAVTDGKITRGSKARLLRDNVVIYDGRITSLKRFKDDAKEVVSGYECGIGLENYDDIKAGDVIEAYTIEEVAATLD